jgi:hypothetical protein
MVIGCGTSKVSELMVDNGGFTSVIRYIILSFIYLLFIINYLLFINH